MNEDIGLELLEKIQSRFEQEYFGNEEITAILSKTETAKAGFEEVHEYAVILGVLLAAAISEYVTPETLPDGRLYYNIAQKILEPTLRNNYDLVNSLAADVQRILDEKQGIHLMPQKAEFPAERVNDIINAASQSGIERATVERRLTSPVETLSISFYDDYIRSNAEFRSQAGLDAYITRTAVADCCKWCTALAGKYKYPKNTPKDVFRRHDNCRCRVVYECEKVRQHVHSKRYWSDEEEREYLRRLDENKAIKRKSNPAHPVRFSREGAAELERIMKKNRILNK